MLCVVLLRALTVAMAASLVLQTAPVPVYAADDTDQTGQEEVIEEILEETPAESPAETTGEDVPVPPEEIQETTEEEPAPVEEVVVEEEAETVTDEALGALEEGNIKANSEIQLTAGAHSDYKTPTETEGFTYAAPTEGTDHATITLGAAKPPADVAAYLKSAAKSADTAYTVRSWTIGSDSYTDETLVDGLTAWFTNSDEACAITVQYAIPENIIVVTLGAHTKFTDAATSGPGYQIAGEGRYSYTIPEGQSKEDIFNAVRALVAPENQYCKWSGFYEIETGGDRTSNSIKGGEMLSAKSEEMDFTLAADPVSLSLRINEATATVTASVTPGSGIDNFPTEHSYAWSLSGYTGEAEGGHAVTLSATTGAEITVTPVAIGTETLTLSLMDGNVVVSTTTVSITVAEETVNTITYHAYDENGDAVSLNTSDTTVFPATYVKSATPVTLPAGDAMAVDGYEFLGWYAEYDSSLEGGAKFKGDQVTAIAAGSTGNKIFYAKYHKHDGYTVTYVYVNADADTAGTVIDAAVVSGALTNADDLLTKYEENVTTGRSLVAAEFADNTFEFDGWYTDAELKTPASEIGAEETGNKTFYGKLYPYYPITYKYVGSNDVVTETFNENIVNDANPKFFTSRSASINLKAATSAKYTVDGWYTGTEDATTHKVTGYTKVTRIPTGSKAPYILYAKVTEKDSFKITYKFKVARGAAELQTLTGVTNPNSKLTEYHANAATPTLDLVPATKAGYVFRGWYHEAELNAAGDEWESLTRVTQITVADKKDYSLVAVFTQAIPIAGIQMTPAMTTAQAGTTVNLTAQLLDGEGVPIAANATDESIVYTSDNAKVTVANGIVTIPANIFEGSTEETINVTITARPSRTNVTPAKSVIVITKNAPVVPTKLAVSVKEGEADKLLTKTGEYYEYEREAAEGAQTIQFSAKAVDGEGNEATVSDVTWEIYGSSGGWFVDQTGKVIVPSSKYSLFATLIIRSVINPEIYETVYISIPKMYTVTYVDEKAEQGKTMPQFEVAEGYEVKAADGSAAASTIAEYVKDGTLSPDKGYVFKGWVRSDGEALEELMPASDLTITAQWAPKAYNITYVIKDGNSVLRDVTNPHEELTSMTVEDAAVTLQPAVKDGYDFIGWYSDESCTAEKAVTSLSIDKEAAKDVTLYAQMHKYATDFAFRGIGKEYTTKPNSSDPANETLTKFTNVATVTEGYSYTPAPTVTYAISDAAGTYASIDSETGEVTIKNVDTSEHSLPHSVVVTATTTAKTKDGADQNFTASYTIHIMASDVEIIPAEQVILSVRTPTGVTIDDTTRLISKEFDYDVTDDRTASVTFAADVKNTDGDKESTSKTTSWEVVQGSAFAKIAGVPRQNGDGFITATLTLNLENLDESQDIVIRATADGAANVYAEAKVHVIRKYNLTFAAGTEDTTLSGMPAAMKAEVGEKVTFTNPTRNGYEVEKWTYNTQDPTGNATVEEFKSNETPMPKQDLTITAQWKAKEIDLKFDYGKTTGNTPIATAPDAKVNYGDAYSSVLEKLPVAPENSVITTNVSGNEEYHRLLGWYTSATTQDDTTDLSKEAVQKALMEPANAAEGVTLYAKTERVAKVTFAYGPGVTVTSPAIPDQYKTDGETVDRPADPVAVGKTFVKWTHSGSGEGDYQNFTTPLNEVANSNYADITVHALWHDNTAKETLTFDAKYYKTADAEGRDVVATPYAPTDYTDLVYGSKVNAPTPPVATGYTFGGWYTDKSFADDKAFDWTAPLTPEPAEGQPLVTTTLFAKWIPDKKTITFDLNGGNISGSTASVPVEVEYGEKLTVEQIPLPVRSGYAFKGWYTEPLAENVDFTSDEIQNKKVDLTAEVTEGATVYAAWQKVTGADSVFAENGGLIIVTNLYKSMAEAQEALKDFAEAQGLNREEVSWGASVKGTTNPKSYANGVARAMEVVVDGESFTVPVRFVQIKKIALTPRYERGSEMIDALCLPGDVVEFMPEITLAGGSMGDQAVSVTVMSAADSIDLNASSFKLPNGSLLAWDAEDKVLKLTATPARNKTEKVTVSFPFAAGTVKATLSVVMTPQAVQIDEGTIELLKGTEAVEKEEADDSIGTAAYYKVKAEKNAVLTLKGMLADDYAVDFTIKAAGDNSKVASVGKVTWKGAQKRVAASDVEFETEIKLKGAAGSVRITLTANDAAKTQSSIIIDVQGDAPVFSTTKVALNQLTTYGAPIDITPAFGENPPKYEVTAVKAPKKTTATNEELLAWFKLNDTIATNRYMVEISAEADVTKLANGKYTVTVKDGEGRTTDLAVTLKASQPKITVKQNKTLNLKKYSDKEQVWLDINTTATLKGVTPSVAGYEAAEAPYLFEVYGNDVYVTYNPDNAPTAQSAKKLKLNFAFDANGYREGAVTATYTLKVTDKLPKLKADPGSVSLFEGLAESAEVYFKEGKNDFNGNITKVRADGTLANYDFEGLDGFAIGVTKKAEGSIAAASGKLYLTTEEYKEEIPVSFKVTAPNVSKLTAKLSKASITLNKNAAGDCYVADITANTAGIAELSLPAQPVTIEGTGIELKFEDDGYGNYYVTAAWKGDDAETKKASAAATAKKSYKAEFEVGFKNAEGDVVQTRKVKLTVKVVDTNPNASVNNKGKTVASKAIKFAAKGQIDLMKPHEGVTLTPKFSGLNVKEVTDIVLGGRDAALFEYNEYWGEILLKEDPSRMVTGHKYQVTIENATVRYPNDETETFTVGQALNLKITQSKPTLKVEPKSRTLTHINNAAGQVHLFDVTASVKGGVPAIKDVRVVQDKTAWQFKLAGMNCDIDDSNYGNGMFSVALTQPTTLKKGTYTLKFLVTFANQAANAKPTEIAYKFTVK